MLLQTYHEIFLRTMCVRRAKLVNDAQHWYHDASTLLEQFEPFSTLHDCQYCMFLMEQGWVIR